MNERLNPSTDPEADDADDLRIRRWLSRSASQAVPSGIELQVLRKVKHRKIAERAVGTGVAAALLAAACVAWQTQPPRSTELAGDSSDRGELRSDIGGMGVNDADLAPMVARPPVASFAHVGRNQLALLESLKSLVDE